MNHEASEKRNREPPAVAWSKAIRRSRLCSIRACSAQTSMESVGGGRGEIEDELVGAAMQISALRQEKKLLKNSLDAAQSGNKE